MSASAMVEHDTRRAVNARLIQIAAVAGIPVEAFFSEPASTAHLGLAELIQLWEAAGTPSMRAEILARTRAVVIEANDRPC